MSMICRCGVVGLLAMAACGTGDNSIDGEVAGGSVRVEFVGAIDANLDAEHHRPTDLALIASDPVSGARFIGAFAFEDTGDGFRRKRWQLELFIPSEPVEGDSHDLGDAIGVGAHLAFQEQRPYRRWHATGGQIVVVSVVGRAARVSFVDVPMTALSESDATGSFDVAGEVRIDNLDAVIEF